MKEQIQKLAKELYSIANVYTCPSQRRKQPFTYSRKSKRKYEALAKHVLERELEARIEENKKFIGAKYTYKCGLDATSTIAELTNQLQQLRGEE